MAKFKSVEAWGPGMYTFECPGCNCAHFIRTKADPDLPKKEVWKWNGDLDKPTVTPSLHVFYPSTSHKAEKTLCHLFITDGNIRFLGDCDHEMKGQTVPIPDWEEDAEESPSDSSAPA